MAAFKELNTRIEALRRGRGVALVGLAILAVALGAGASLAEAAILANHAAGVVVGKFGPATVTGDELLAAL